MFNPPISQPGNAHHYPHPGFDFQHQLGGLCLALSFALCRILVWAGLIMLGSHFFRGWPSYALVASANDWLLHCVANDADVCQLGVGDQEQQTVFPAPGAT